MVNPERSLSVVHVLAPARFGGLETCVIALAAGLHEAGDAVCVVPVLTPEESLPHPLVEALENRGVAVRPVAVKSRDYFGERRHVRSILRDASAQVVHTHGYRPDIVDAPLARGLGLPTVTTVHGFTAQSGRGLIYEWLQKRSFRQFDVVVAVSEKLRGELVRHGVPDTSLVTVRNAWAPTSPPLSRSVSRAQLGLGDTGPVVGWVGRLTSEKGPDIFVRAAALVQEHASFSMVGDGRMLEECKAMAADAGSSDRFHWHGAVQNAGSLLTAFDALVLTSWTEGTPMVLLEAMSSGVPIVTTAVGGIPDVLSGDEAILCEAGNVEQIAAGVRSILLEPDSALARAKAARARVERDFAVGPWIDRHRQMYASLIEQT